MSCVACRTVLVTAAGIVLISSQPGKHARACPPGGAKAAAVVFENQTADEILVYLDGAFAGRAAPRRSDKACVSPNRLIEVVGRSACDAWGPFVVRAAPGGSVTVRFTEQGRTSRRLALLN